MNEMKIFENEENTPAMNGLIKVDYSSGNPLVSARELHDFLEVGADFRHWFPRMCEYGFVSGQDFNMVKIDRVQQEGTRMVSRIVDDALLTIDMAKEICMLQRNEKGKIARRYFLRLEKDWNSPEKVMARALQIADRQIKSLEVQVGIQQQQIAEMQPKASYYDIVLNCKDLVAISTIAKDYGWSARRMNSYLHEKGVQYRQGDIWLLYQQYAEMGYTSTKTHVHPGNDGTMHTTVHTYWTQRGRLFLYDLFKTDGILPLIEQDGKVA